MPSGLPACTSMRVARQLCPQLSWNRFWLGLLRRRGDRLEPEQRLRWSRLLARHPQLQAVYAMKEKICALLCLKPLSKESGRQRTPQLRPLIVILKQSGLEAAQTPATSLSEWIEERARMWRFSRNNGSTEGFPRKMKPIQRRADGFRSLPNDRLRVIAQCG